MDLSRGKLPDRLPFSFEVHDLSLGGVAPRTSDDRAAQLPLALKLPGTGLILGPLGVLAVDLQLVSSRPIALPSGKQIYQVAFALSTCRAWRRRDSSG